MAERFVTHLGPNYDPEYLCELSDEELAGVIEAEAAALKE